MRSFRLNHPAGRAVPCAILILFATLLPGAPPPSAAQDTLAEPGVDAARDSAAAQMRAEDGDIVRIGDYTVNESDAVGDVVVTGGDLTVLGEVDGDALVIGGDLILDEAGVVTGDALAVGGEIVRNEDWTGRVGGEMRVVDELSALTGRLDLDEARSEQNRDEIRSEIRREIQQNVREHRPTRGGSSWFSPIRDGFAGLISTLAFGLVLAGIGAVLIFYGRAYLDTVSDTARVSTVRAGAVGLAVGFLMFPAFIVLIVALAVSIIGIPLLLLAIPLYPVAIAAAVAFGLLGAAHALGERTAEQRTPIELSYRNSYSYLFIGLGMLLAPMFLAHLLGMTGFLGWLGTLIEVFAWVLISIAATVGLGAVILSRAGTRRTFARPAGDEPPGPDPLLDEEPFTHEPHA